ncbi:hypothetical protein [Sphingobium chungbukense]|uniref:hypothetical protein n=1 Tax=Sphingobium chungbukense TaxID=56193 RepID=UPI001E2ABD16|nr:hypothetical protein [Sphingobium chungbukense]
MAAKKKSASPSAKSVLVIDPLGLLAELIDTLPRILKTFVVTDATRTPAAS